MLAAGGTNGQDAGVATSQAIMYPWRSPYELIKSYVPGTFLDQGTNTVGPQVTLEWIQSLFHHLFQVPSLLEILRPTVPSVIDDVSVVVLLFDMLMF